MKYVLAVVVVVLGGLLVATLVGNGGTAADAQPPEAGTPAPPATRPPAAPAPAAGSGQRKPPAPGSYASRYAEAKDPLRDCLAKLIADLVTGAADAEKRMELERRLVLAMEELRLGDTFSRADTARKTIDTLLTDMKRFMPRGGAHKELDEGMQAAIRRQADTLAQGIRSLSPKKGKQHTGTAMAAVDFQTPAGYQRVRWAHIGGFEYRDHMKLPEGVLALQGKKVAVAGYMITLGEVEDIREFLLVESGWSCCFGIPPDVNQVIEVRIPKDRPGVEFTTTPVAVTGTMDVGEEVEDGFVISVYRIHADKVIDVD